MQVINYETFKQIELKVAKVLEAESVEGSGKLIKLKIDLSSETRQIIAGIGKKYQPEDLIGKNIIVVVNLEPRTLMGLESRGMLLAASAPAKSDSSSGEKGEKEGPILLTTMEDIVSGSEIK